MRGSAASMLFPLLALASPIVAEDLVAEQVKRVLNDLNDDDFKKRESASVAAARLPVHAVDLLKKALADENASQEVKQRLPRILENLCAKHGMEIWHMRVESRRAWLKKNLQDAYERVGRKNEKWDELAREALRLVVLNWSQDPKRDRNEEPRILALTSKAISLGCNDALIAYLNARFTEAVNGPDIREDLDLHTKAGSQLEDSGYSKLIVLVAVLKVANILSFGTPTPDQVEAKKAQLATIYKAALDNLAEVLSDPDIPDSWIRDMFENMTNVGQELEKDRKKAIEGFCACLEKARPKSSLVHAFRGGGYVTYAWDARGGGWGSTVTDEGWKAMKERLAVAEEALNRAWLMDPSNSYIARRMIALVMGSGGDREKMELWFKRAMAVHPNDTETCEAKLNFLEPKWHGSVEDMLAFGRECFKTGDWNGDVPFLLVRAHNQAAYYSGKGYQIDPAYFKKPEVWQEIQDVFESCLKARPKDALKRSLYANIACTAEKWDLAAQQFKLLGDDAYPIVFGGIVMFNKKRARAAKVPVKPDAEKSK